MLTDALCRASYHAVYDDSILDALCFAQRHGFSGIQVAVENYQMDEMVREVLQPHLDAGWLFLCWDLAKSYSHDGTRDETQEAFFWTNLQRIRQVHLHDSGDGRAHRAVGTGQLDFMRYLPRLCEAGVLDFCHEVRPRERAAESLANLRKLIEERENQP